MVGYTNLAIDVYRYVFAHFQLELRGNSGELTPSKTIPTFLTLYIFGFIYELVLVYDALRLKNTIQVIGLCICNVGLLIYGAVQMDQIQDAVLTLSQNDNIDSGVWGDMKPFLIAIPCIIGLGSLLMSFIAWKLYDEFAWTIYKHISADLRMKRRYLTFQVGIRIVYEYKLSLTYRIDLHCASEIRFLFLPWIHRPVRCHCNQQRRYRIRSNPRRYPCHHCHSFASSFLDSKRKHIGNDYHYR